MTIYTPDFPLASELLHILHTLNEAHAAELSSLSAPKLEGLMASAFVRFVVDDGAGLIIACDETSLYDSPNFLWFRARFDRFVYIDRVVVSDMRRGEGLARALYDRVFAAARAAGQLRVVCEVNFDPPNPASEAFHARLGFAGIASARLANGKGVRYLEKIL